MKVLGTDLGLGKIILIIVAAIVVIIAARNYSKLKQFILEVKAELGKVSWSSRHELMGATVVVIGITFITGMFIGMVDLALSKILSLVFR